MSARPDDTMRLLSAYIADTDLGSVYKMVLRLGSPDFLVGRTASLWGRYFDVGELTPTQVGKKHWTLKLVMPLDEEVAQRLRYIQKTPVLLVINKSDTPEMDVRGGDFYKPGLGKPVSLSARQTTHPDTLLHSNP